jgi:hypothetical protein
LDEEESTEEDEVQFTKIDLQFYNSRRTFKVSNDKNIVLLPSIF